MNRTCRPIRAKVRRWSCRKGLLRDRRFGARRVLVDDLPLLEWRRLCDELGDSLREGLQLILEGAVSLRFLEAVSDDDKAGEIAGLNLSHLVGERLPIVDRHWNEDPGVLA